MLLRNALRYLSHFHHFFTLPVPAGFLCDFIVARKLRAKVAIFFEICKFICRNGQEYANLSRNR